jgi:hypothetical protein
LPEPNIRAIHGSVIALRLGGVGKPIPLYPIKEWKIIRREKAIHFDVLDKRRACKELANL